MTAELLALLDELDAAREKATPGEWYQARHIHVFSENESRPGIGQMYIPADAALIVAAVNSLPELTGALRNVLTGLDHLDRMRPTFSSIEARMAYADTIDHVRACIAAALTPEQADR